MNGKRNKNIGFRVTPEEKLMIKQAADAFQKTVSGFIRDIILGISGDVVNIRTLNYNNINYKPVKTLHPPPLRTVPKSFQAETKSRGRGSALDFKNCMAELKKVLKDKVLLEC